MDYTERYIFEAEWYDQIACILKQFYLYYYPIDNTVELFDLNTKKTFLRRTKCEGIQAKDFYVGAVVAIYSRNIKIIDFADESTKNKLQTLTQKTFAMIKPDVMNKMGEILKRIMAKNFHIANIRMVRLTQKEATEFCKGKSSSQLSHIINFLTSEPVLALELLGNDAIEHWLKVIGPENIDEARKKAPSSLRACYGTDDIHNGLHGSENLEAAQRELSFFFPDTKSKLKGPVNTATFHNCTCCIIKPHAIQQKLLGQIIEDIQNAGYTISAIQQFHLDTIYAKDICEVYKGVLEEYGAMVSELQSGPCVAMEIIRKDTDNNTVHADFRKFCGPMDPDIARQIRPNTLRAKYGKTKVQNAVHCSDLLQDGPLEVEYFFKVLDTVRI